MTSIEDLLKTEINLNTVLDFFLLTEEDIKKEDFYEILEENYQTQLNAHQNHPNVSRITACKDSLMNYIKQKQEKEKVASGVEETNGDDKTETSETTPVEQPQKTNSKGYKQNLLSKILKPIGIGAIVLTALAVLYFGFKDKVFPAISSDKKLNNNSKFFYLLALNKGVDIRKVNNLVDESITINEINNTAMSKLKRYSGTNLLISKADEKKALIKILQSFNTPINEYEIKPSDYSNFIEMEKIEVKEGNKKYTFEIKINTVIDIYARYIVPDLLGEISRYGPSGAAMIMGNEEEKKKFNEIMKKIETPCSMIHIISLKYTETDLKKKTKYLDNLCIFLADFNLDGISDKKTKIDSKDFYKEVNEENTHKEIENIEGEEANTQNIVVYGSDKHIKIRNKIIDDLDKESQYERGKLMHGPISKLIYKAIFKKNLYNNIIQYGFEKGIENALEEEINMPKMVTESPLSATMYEALLIIKRIKDHDLAYKIAKDAEPLFKKAIGNLIKKEKSRKLN